MNVELIKTQELGTPKADPRTRSDYLKDYREFDLELGPCFDGSFSYNTSRILTQNEILTLGVAYYGEEARIIDKMNIFPGSQAFFARLLEWAFRTKRAYKDARIDADSDLKAALDICVCECDEFVRLVMKYA